MCHSLVTGPQVEPVNLVEAAAAVGGVDGDEEFLLSCLVVAARAYLEAEVGRAFITQRWSLEIAHWPDTGFYSPPRPLAPFQRLNSIKLRSEGREQDLRLGGVAIEDTGEWPILAIGKEETWRAFDEADAIILELTVGYGEDPEDVPVNLRRAVTELAAHWFRHREPIGFGNGTLSVPRIVFELIAPYRAPAIRRTKTESSD